VAGTVPKSTVLEPGVEPKFDPSIITVVPTGPEFGLNELITGGGLITNEVIVKAVNPLTVTYIG